MLRMNFSNSSDLQNYISSKLKKERIFRLILIPLSIFYVVFLVAVFVLPTDLFWILSVIMTLILIPASIIYIVCFWPYYRYSTWLRTLGENEHREVRDGKAIISKKPFVVIPYSMIAMVTFEKRDSDYDSVREAHEVPYECVGIYCKDGKCFKIENVFRSDAQHLYERILGEVHGVIQNDFEAYLERCPIAKAKYDRQKKRAYIIWGIVLLVLLAIFCTISLCTGSITVAGIFMLLALLIGGIALIWRGND